MFRKYDSDIDSYRDHSIFYQTEEDILNSLLMVITEMARGLKSYYATNKYDKLLIKPKNTI